MSSGVSFGHVVNESSALFQLLDVCMLDLGCLQFTYSVLAASALYHMTSQDVALAVSGVYILNINIKIFT